MKRGRTHSVSHPVKLRGHGKTGLGQLWNATPAAPHRPTNTCNGTPTPIGKGAVRSLEWYRRND